MSRRTREILPLSDSRPLRAAKKVSLREITQPLFQQLIDDMIATMHSVDSMGISAPQIGVNKRLFIMEVPNEHDNAIVIINPTLTCLGGKTMGLEGCCSKPGFVALMNRCSSVLLSGVDRDGHKLRMECSGLVARCAQHELDHLEAASYPNEEASLQPATRIVKGTPELAQVASLLDVAVSMALRARDGIEINTRWEAPILAMALNNLCIRNVEAVANLARIDEMLAPAAWANARNALEVAIRAIWLIHPKDPMDCEMRWLALLDEYERFHRNLGDKSDPLVPNAVSPTHRQDAESIRRFTEGVAAAAKDLGYERYGGRLTIEKMLEETGFPLYSTYREASQYLHGTIFGASPFLKELGIHKKWGEFTSLGDWYHPLRICWWSLRESASAVLQRISGSRRTMNWRAIQTQIETGLHNLQHAAPRREYAEPRYPQDWIVFEAAQDVGYF